MEKSDPIAVIGAGAAGLSAAFELKKRGYDRITVYDSLPRVGGKCLTQTIEGRRFEIGALIVGIQYDNILEMLRAVGLETAPLDPIRIVDMDNMAAEVWPFHRWGVRGFLKVLRLVAACLRHHRFMRVPGFAEADACKEAACTFDECLRRAQLEFTRSAVAPYYVCWGYGYLEEVDAVYVFKLLDFYLRTLGKILLPSSRMRFSHFIPEGYQRLWEKIAQDFECCLGARIVSIRRDRRVTVETVEGARSFEALILACPLRKAAQFLDADKEERALAGRIKTVDFVTLVCEVAGLPPHHLVFVKNTLTPLRRGHIISWYRRWKDRNVYVFYLMGAPGIANEHLLANARGDLAGMGARLGRIHRLDHWDYFPHVDPADIAAGYFRRWEALQGRRRTWYAGELLSFPTTEHVAAYSRSLVRRYF
jgi:predicted NAD/FAD-binding protein